MHLYTGCIMTNSPLDELSQVSADQLAESAYMLVTDRQGRATKEGLIRKSLNGGSYSYLQEVSLTNMLDEIRKG